MKKPRFKLIALNKTEAEILIYGPIGPWGDVKARDIIDQIKAAEDRGYQTLNLRINSGGGDVFEGIAIYNAIRRSTITINAYIDGLAASMASIVAIAGSKVYMAKNARIMIHQSSGFSEGQSEDMKRQAELMDQINSEMAEIYASRTGKPKKWVTENWMQNGKDTWFNSREALDNHLVDEIIEGIVKEPGASDTKTNQRLAAYYDDQLDTFESKFSNSNKSETMNWKQIFNAFKSIQLDGAPVVQLSASGDDNDNAAEVANAVTQIGARLTELSTEVQAERKAREAAEAKVKELEEQNATDRADSLVDAALSVGKITASEVESYKKLAAANYDETKKILDARKAHKSVTEQLNGAEGAADDKLLKMSWDEADKAGKLAAIKASHPEHFKKLYKETFNAEYKGS